MEKFVKIDKHMFSRILYPNPISILVVNQNENVEGTAMILSWISPIDNNGHFVFSINKKRNSYKCLFDNDNNNDVDDNDIYFTLNIPIYSMNQDLLNIGTTNSFDFKNDDVQYSVIPKLNHFKIKTHNLIGNVDIPNTLNNKHIQFINDSRIIAHLLCKIESKSDTFNNHSLITATILDARINQNYWNGKNFIYNQNIINNDLNQFKNNQILSFLGTKQFAIISSANML